MKWRRDTVGTLKRIHLRDICHYKNQLHVWCAKSGWIFFVAGTFNTSILIAMRPFGGQCHHSPLHCPSFFFLFIRDDCEWKRHQNFSAKFDFELSSRLQSKQFNWSSMCRCRQFSNNYANGRTKCHATNTKWREVLFSMWCASSMLFFRLNYLFFRFHCGTDCGAYTQ